MDKNLFNFSYCPCLRYLCIMRRWDTDKLRSGNFKPDLLYYLHVIEKNEEYYVFTSYIFRDIFFLILTVSRGEMISPLKIPLLMSANFGELRPNHFHSGLI